MQEEGAGVDGEAGGVHADDAPAPPLVGGHPNDVPALLNVGAVHNNSIWHALSNADVAMVRQLLQADPARAVARRPWTPQLPMARALAVRAHTDAEDERLAEIACVLVETATAAWLQLMLQDLEAFVGAARRERTACRCAAARALLTMHRQGQVRSGHAPAGTMY